MDDTLEESAPTGPETPSEEPAEVVPDVTEPPEAAAPEETAEALPEEPETPIEQPEPGPDAVSEEAPEAPPGEAVEAVPEPGPEEAPEAASDAPTVEPEEAEAAAEGPEAPEEPEVPSEKPEAAPVEEAEEVPVPSVTAGIPAWPFLVYVGVWAVYSAAAVTLLFSNPAASPVESAYYGPLLLGGLALATIGPLLALVVWLRVRARTPEHLRHGLFITALVRGAAATFAGVALWVVGLVMLDALRLGWL